MSSTGSGANYGGRQQNQTAYIKRFVDGFTPDVWAIRPFDGLPSIQPAAPLDVVIPQDLYVQGTIYGNVVVPSDSRLKCDISYLEPLKDTVPQEPKESRPLMNLRPCSFRYKNDVDRNLHYGFIAQEVQPVLPVLMRQVDKSTYGIAMDEMIPLLVHHIQALQREVDELKKMKHSEINVTHP